MRWVNLKSRDGSKRAESGFEASSRKVSNEPCAAGKARMPAVLINKNSAFGYTASEHRHVADG